MKAKKNAQGIYEARSSTSRAMRQGDVEELEVPGLCVAQAKKLRKWVKVHITGTSPQVGEAFAASNGVTLQVVPADEAERNSDLQWWGIPSQGEKTWRMAEKNWKKFVRASKEWAKAHNFDLPEDPIQVNDTKDKQAPPKYPPRVTHGPKTRAALNQLLEGSEKYRGMVKELCDKHDMLPKEAKEHLELSNIHHFASLCKDPGPLSFECVKGDCDDVGVELEIGGEMWQGVFFHNGYRMIQARETQWVPEEKLLCVGFEPNRIIASEEDAHAIEHLVSQYEQHRTDVYPERVDSEDVKRAVAASLGQEQASSEATAELERVRCLVEKQRQVIRQVINDVRDEATDALRNAVIYEAEAHEARAAELRDMLSCGDAEHRLLGRIEAAMDGLEGDVSDAEDADELSNDGMLSVDELQKVWLGSLPQDDEEAEGQLPPAKAGGLCLGRRGRPAR